jgi:hypothetical protein
MTARNTVHNVGRAGLVKDTKPHLLPSEFWTDARNVRFEPNKVFAMGGVEEVRAKTGLLSVGLISSPTTNFFVYSTGGQIFAWDGTTEADITREAGGNYSDDIDNLFDIFGYNGFGVFNNGIDVPQQWGASFVSGALTPLSNWDSTWQAKSLRPFKSFLIALNITEDGTPYPHKMRWSDPAEPGAVPSSWDETDATKEAGEFNFSDVSRGVLVDGRELGDRFFVYKEGAIWVFEYTGGLSVFSRRLLVDNIGLRVRRSLVNLPLFGPNKNAVQFFVGDENFYVMDGLRLTPVWENVFKNEILKVVDLDLWATRGFSVVNYRENEVWFCVPEKGSEYCNLAFTLNYVNGTSSIRSLSGASTIVSGIGIYSSTASVQEDIPFSDETYFSDDTGYYDLIVTQGSSIIVEASPVLESMYYLDVGMSDYDGSPYYSYVAREAIATIKNDSRNEKADIVDYNRRKMVVSLTPKLYENSIGLKVGSQENDVEAITWTDLGLVTPEEYKFFFNEPISGRFISFQFYSIPNSTLELAGFDYEVAVLGEF